MADIDTWSWDDIFALLSRERGSQEDLILSPAWVKGGLAEAGAIADLSCDGRYLIPVSDGSTIEVDDNGHEWALRLIAAPLPEVSLGGDLSQLGWIALPACLIVLGALGVIS